VKDPSLADGLQQVAWSKRSRPCQKSSMSSSLGSDTGGWGLCTLTDLCSSPHRVQPRRWLSQWLLESPRVQDVEARMAWA
jgi:hypothetical protein